jgi:hypothetical protein
MSVVQNADGTNHDRPRESLLLRPRLPFACQLLGELRGGRLARNKLEVVVFGRGGVWAMTDWNNDDLTLYHGCTDQSHRRLIRLPSLPPSLERIGAAELRPTFPAQSLHIGRNIPRAHRLAADIA